MRGYYYSWSLASIGLIACIIMLIISKPFITYRNPQDNNVTKGVGLFFFIYTLNSIFSFWEWDTYHIWWVFNKANSYTTFEILNYEPIYNWIAKITGNDYFIWRIMIWTPACLFVYWTGLQLDIINRNFFLSITLFIAFLYGSRNILGLSMLLMGLVLIIKNKSQFKLLGLILVFVSTLFHKSMSITLLFALIALLPQSKKSIIFMLFLYPFFTILSSFIIERIVSRELVIYWGDYGNNSDIAAYYAGQKRASLTFYGYINQIITFLPQYLALIYTTKRVVFDKILKEDEQKRIWTFILRFSFICIYFASTFYFTDSSIWIFERFKYMGMIPLSFILAKVWSLEPKTNFWIKSIIILQLFSLSFRWLTQWYHWT